jgi:uncharacterized membrane protein
MVIPLLCRLKGSKYEIISNKSKLHVIPHIIQFFGIISISISLRLPSKITKIGKEPFLFFSEYPADILAAVFNPRFYIDLDKSDIQEMYFWEVTEAMRNVD